jgi:hypothetical protein
MIALKQRPPIPGLTVQITMRVYVKPKRKWLKWAGIVLGAIAVSEAVCWIVR